MKSGPDLDTILEFKLRIGAIRPEEERRTDITPAGIADTVIHMTSDYEKHNLQTRSLVNIPRNMKKTKGNENRSLGTTFTALCTRLAYRNTSVPPGFPASPIAYALRQATHPNTLS